MLSNVQRVSSCPTCLMCLRTLCAHVPTCICFLRAFIFLCDLCAFIFLRAFCAFIFLRALCALNFLHALRAFLFLRTLRAFLSTSFTCLQFFKCSQFLMCLMWLHFFHKMWNNSWSTVISWNKPDRGRINQK